MSSSPASKFSGAKLKFTFAVGVLLVLIAALLLGRGFSANPYTGEVKVEAKSKPASSPTAETFGVGSGIAVGNGAAVGTEIKLGAAAQAKQSASSVGQSSATYVTYGAASPIAVGTQARASATLEQR